MSKLGKSAFTWLEFDKDGNVADQDVVRLKLLLSQPGLTDLVVLSHGWKNTKDDAEHLYATLWENACKTLSTAKAETTVVVGVVWPAKQYRTDFDGDELVNSVDAGVLGLGSHAATHDINDSQFEQILLDFQELIGDTAAETVAAARAAKSNVTATIAADLVEAGAKAVGVVPAVPDPELRDDGKGILGAMSEPTLAQAAIVALALPPILHVTPEMGSAQGLGSTVSSLVSGSKAAIARFLNQLTYYEMKKRAGIVGKSLAKNVLTELAPSTHVKLHLVGHSFGARLVTAAANENLGASKLSLFSLTLLQGAFSHNGLAGPFGKGSTGAFSKVVGKVEGPVAVTHTHNDLACTLAYAIASRLSRDMVNSIGDRNDAFGSMGANGPQHLPTNIIVETDPQQAFAPQRQKVNVFRADGFIVKTKGTDAHNNVTNPTVGKLLAAVIDS